MHERPLQVDRKRDQLLTHDLVEVTLDPAAIGIGRDDQPLPRRAAPRPRVVADRSLPSAPRRFRASSVIGLPTP